MPVAKNKKPASTGRDAQSGTGEGSSGAPARSTPPGLFAGFKDGLRTGTDRTLSDLVLSRTPNFLTGVHVLAYIAMYGRFLEEHGREPRSVRELGAAVGARHATVHRYQQLFKAAFPEHETPLVIWLVSRDQVPGNDVDTMALQLGGVRFA
jgi:hypothetical protein